MLNFPGAWRFDSPGEIPSTVISGFVDLIARVAAQGRKQDVLEHFKGYFANAAGTTAYRSSSVSWAESDLYEHMQRAGENAPVFIEAFYDACSELAVAQPQLALPDLTRINRVLAEAQCGYRIRPPDLSMTMSEVQAPVVIPSAPPSLDEQAQEMIQRSLKESERLLAEGRDRLAVQEILWLLETVSTAFQGLETDSGTVHGKYFNRIAEDLRRHYRGQALDQILGWMTALHGYLSSPTGGGIRHGATLKAGVAAQTGEARLFCNLIRSYIGYLLSEYSRLRG